MSFVSTRVLCPKPAMSCTERADKLHNLHNESNILDVSSGILHLAGDSLVPESINKNCLEDAKVLQQVNKKFIPIVGGGVLAILTSEPNRTLVHKLKHYAMDVVIVDYLVPLLHGLAGLGQSTRVDTIRHGCGCEICVRFGMGFLDMADMRGERRVHPADERIRLEELRQKVLPEIGYQLLHNYADQIQNWGWLCNIRSLGSRNLNLLHRQPTVVTLNAVKNIPVPCIVGVNLTDVDLLEFLQQLADTDESSTIPPSVHRVLNSKACRGAIMFGDTLLPSECSLIVEELKQTSLCFQCAHGRPTTVPLVNLEALHKQIAKLGLWNGGSNELWHGLHQHEPSLERAAQRLSSARGLS
ncbi:hypothetical protein TEA_015872 [Camellia sinensis var. sinensis]|uniref:MutL C-terminal dimerisation domain-containing protein n=1 Tax=Camellia sinensis var. sinensis TaxID=542762 RepID=A0A4S4DEP9_CAMSN|nr:hypothetical protein TEA_015872 [Camellia sinensis var. sinensis]